MSVAKSCVTGERFRWKCASPKISRDLFFSLGLRVRYMEAYCRRYAGLTISLAMETGAAGITAAVSVRAQASKYLETG